MIIELAERMRMAYLTLAGNYATYFKKSDAISALLIKCRQGRKILKNY